MSLLASEELATQIYELDSTRYINGIGGEIEVKHTAVVKDTLQHILRTVPIKDCGNSTP